MEGLEDERIDILIRFPILMSLTTENGALQSYTEVTPILMENFN